MPTKRSRGWCFTINNPEEFDVYELDSLSMDDQVRYLMYGYEKGKKGTHHFQGYILFYDAKTLSKVKKVLKRAHLEPQKGSDIEAIVYCMKDGDYVEYGKRPHQGVRSDLDLIYQDLKFGKKNMFEIGNEYPTQFFYHHRAMKILQDHYQRFETCIVVYDKYDVDSCKAVQEYIGPHTYEFQTLDSLWMLYFSKKYRYILLPKTEYWIDNLKLQENINYIVVDGV